MWRLPAWLELRQLLMAIGLGYIGWFFFSQKISWHRLGLTRHQFVPAFKLIFWQIIAAAGIIILAYWVFPSCLSVPAILADITSRPAYQTALRYILISVPLQEIIFRAYLINRLKIIRLDKKQILFCSAFIFSLIHAPFNNLYLTLGSAVLGWWWAANYLKFNNLWAIMGSHGLIGLIYIVLMV